MGIGFSAGVAQQNVLLRDVCDAEGDVARPAKVAQRTRQETEMGQMPAFHRQCGRHVLQREPARKRYLYCRSG